MTNTAAGTKPAETKDKAVAPKTDASRTYYESVSFY